MLELVRMGYAGQLEAIEKARDAAEDPEQALLEMSRAWCRFAFESPDLYQVMYGLGGVSFPVTELRKEGEKIAGAIAEVLEEIFAQNGKEAEDVWAKVTLAWGTMHGLVSLDMAGRLTGGKEEAERLADQASRDYLNAWLS